MIDSPTPLTSPSFTRAEFLALTAEQLEALPTFVIIDDHQYGSLSNWPETQRLMREGPFDEPEERPLLRTVWKCDRCDATGEMAEPHSCPLSPLVGFEIKWERHEDRLRRFPPHWMAKLRNEDGIDVLEMGNVSNDPFNAIEGARAALDKFEHALREEFDRHT